MLTRKDFILMAEQVKAIENVRRRKAMAEHTAEICAKSNPRFDRPKFLAACGVE